MIGKSIISCMNFIITNNKTNLNVTALNFSNLGTLDFIEPLVRAVYKPLENILPEGNYFLYIRDIREYSIDGKYPGGHTYNKHESIIALPSWSCDKNYIKSTIAHELHHLLRWNRAGYGSTLGEAILSEGLATYYETIVSKWIPPWAKTVPSKEIILQAKKEWFSDNYNHAEWFFESKNGRWLGYSIGYEIAKRIYKGKFDLTNSLDITAKDINLSVIGF